MGSEGFWLTILGAIIGLIGSIAVTHYYYKKNKPIEGMLESITSALRLANVRDSFPNFFNSGNAKFYLENGFNSSIPEDEPQLDQVIFDQAIVSPGTKVGVLLKVVDLGYNLQIPHGVLVRGPHGDLPVHPLGLGYLHTSFKMQSDDPAGEYKLVIELTDEARNTTTTEVRFRVTPRRGNRLVDEQ